MIDNPLRLFAPESYWNATDDERNAVVGGCGPGGIGDWLVPDTVYFLSIKEACKIHDWMYAFGETAEDKVEADEVFLNNMIRIIDAETWFDWVKWLRKKRAYKYYWAVKNLGGPAFWDDKNKDSEFRWVSQ